MRGFDAVDRKLDSASHFGFKYCTLKWANIKELGGKVAGSLVELEEHKLSSISGMLYQVPSAEQSSPDGKVSLG